MPWERIPFGAECVGRDYQESGCRGREFHLEPSALEEITKSPDALGENSMTWYETLDFEF